MPAAFTKDPGDVLDYSFSWDAWLASGETISSSTWTTSGPGITIASTSNTSTGTTVWLSGGSNTAVYQVKNQIVTNQGRTVERTMTINVAEKNY